ncbi:MAG TPA: hypothetical protein VF632_15575 [Longimicrobium sp.]|jgi:hypothetical protein
MDAITERSRRAKNPFALFVVTSPRAYSFSLWFTVSTGEALGDSLVSCVGAQGDRPTVVRHLGHVPAHVIVQRQPAFRRSSTTAAAVNCLDTDPASNTVSGVLGTSCSRLAMP